MSPSRRNANPARDATPPAASKSYAAFGVLAFFMVLCNFGLDVLRRFDFESERGDIEGQLSYLRTGIDDSLVMLNEVQDSRRSLMASYDTITEASESLLSLTADVHGVAGRG